MHKLGKRTFIVKLSGRSIENSFTKVNSDYLSHKKKGPPLGEPLRKFMI
jgi:hypothetical protein